MPPCRSASPTWARTNKYQRAWEPTRHQREGSPAWRTRCTGLTGQHACWTPRPGACVCWFLQKQQGFERLGTQEAAATARTAACVIEQLPLSTQPCTGKWPLLAHLLKHFASDSIQGSIYALVARDLSNALHYVFVLRAEHLIGAALNTTALMHLS